ncbi:hypothetical protein OS493_003789 [Desmophyllum pertusum]|uniref:Uncharacterized protein n=1 Tax=Desmophyllum pertusum TaxID=174260 RepID=A0A9X0A645_9CNID|nr:hypothetical protein OS493_003789 [Desmophyllum pertusum]
MEYSCACPLLFLSLCFTSFSGFLCADYDVKVTTGSSFGAGTDAIVIIKIIGTKGSTAGHELVGSGDPFEKGSTDHFFLKNVADVGEITAIALKRNEDGWFPKVAARSITCEPGFRKNQTSGVCFGRNNLWFTTICTNIQRFRGTSRSLAVAGHAEVHCLPQWVLTSAYCVYGKKASNIFVRLGAYYREKTIGTEQDITVEKIFIHPKYHRPNLFSNDLALLKLSRPASLSHEAGLICLPNKDLPLRLLANHVGLLDGVILIFPLGPSLRN